MHFKLIIIPLLTTAASLALAAPAAAPILAPASALAARDSTYNSRGTSSYDANAPCSSDLAHFELTYNYVVHCTTPDASGTQKCTFHYNEHGTATTWDSGTKYQIVNVENIQYKYEVNAPYEYTYTENIRVRATKQGTGLVEKGTQLVTYSYTVANGFQVDVKKAEFECT